MKKCRYRKEHRSIKDWGGQKVSACSVPFLKTNEELRTTWRLTLGTGMTIPLNNICSVPNIGKQTQLMLAGLQIRLHSQEALPFLSCHVTFSLSKTKSGILIHYMNYHSVFCHFDLFSIPSIIWLGSYYTCFLFTAFNLKGREILSQTSKILK